MTRPTAGILVDGPTAAGFATFVGELSRWCDPVAWDHSMPTPAAWLLSSPDVPTPVEAPRVAWVRHSAELDLPGATDAILVSDDDEVASDARVVKFGDGLDLTDVPYLTPFVRARYRRARGLPDPLLVATGTTVAPHLERTLYAVASAAVAHSDALITALSLGTPCVTDATSAAAAGADHGVHVLVAKDGDEDDTAAALARDEETAASLSRAGRRLIESRFDRSSAARRVAGLLGLRAGTPDERVNAVLDELSTPTSARIRARARAAVG